MVGAAVAMLIDLEGRGRKWEAEVGREGGEPKRAEEGGLKNERGEKSQIAESENEGERGDAHLLLSRVGLRVVVDGGHEGGGGEEGGRGHERSQVTNARRFFRTSTSFLEKERKNFSLGSRVSKHSDL